MTIWRSTSRKSWPNRDYNEHQINGNLGDQPINGVNGDDIDLSMDKMPMEYPINGILTINLIKHRTITTLIINFSNDF